MLNLDTNQVTPEGVLREREAAAMNLKANLLEPYELPKVAVDTDANTSGDSQTSAHMKNWMECVCAGYNHTVACAMANAAYRTGLPVHFDPSVRQIMAGGKVFKY